MSLPPVATWCFIACAHDFSSSSSMSSAERRYVQNEALSCLGGTATPAYRSKTPLTSCVQPLELCPYWCDEASGKRYGFSPTKGSQARLCSYASTKGWMPAGSVLTCGP